MSESSVGESSVGESSASHGLSPEPSDAPLRAEHVVRFHYERTVGGAIGHFLRGLARGQLWGSVTAGGRVVLPPVDHDPDTGAPVAELVQVGDTGTVRAWSWVPEPEPDHPLTRPFAFAMVQLDGADTTMLHVLDVAAPAQLATGLRVRADWRGERTGSIRDIRAFVPETSPTPTASAAGAGDPPTRTPPGSGDQPTPGEPQALTVGSELALRYAYEPGRVLSHFLRELGRHRIEGGRCPSCAEVYVPPRPRCPVCGTGPLAAVAIADTGVVESFAVVRVPPFGAAVEVPFAWAWIRLDGVAVPFPHLLGDLVVDEVWVGLRVQAVWVPESELAPTWASIRHFGPCR